MANPASAPPASPDQPNQSPGGRAAQFAPGFNGGAQTFAVSLIAVVSVLAQERHRNGARWDGSLRRARLGGGRRDEWRLAHELPGVVAAPADGNTRVLVPFPRVPPGKCSCNVCYKFPRERGDPGRTRRKYGGPLAAFPRI